MPSSSSAGKYRSRLFRYDTIAHVSFVLLLFLALNFVAAGVIVAIEGYNYTDSFYLAMSASCCSGFGDVAPRTPGGRWFISFFQLFGFGWFFYILSYIVIIDVHNNRLY